MTGTVDVAGIASKVSAVDEKIMQFLPEISMLAGFIPGAAPVMAFEPLVLELLTVLDNAAKAIAAGNTSAAFSDVVNEITSHLTPGKPNSPILSAAPAWAPQSNAMPSGN